MGNVTTRLRHTKKERPGMMAVTISAHAWMDTQENTSVTTSVFS